MSSNYSGQQRPADASPGKSPAIEKCSQGLAICDALCVGIRCFADDARRVVEVEPVFGDEGLFYEVGTAVANTLLQADVWLWRTDFLRGHSYLQGNASRNCFNDAREGLKRKAPQDVAPFAKPQKAGGLRDVLYVRSACPLSQMPRDLPVYFPSI